MTTSYLLCREQRAIFIFGPTNERQKTDRITPKMPSILFVPSKLNKSTGISRSVNVYRVQSLKKCDSVKLTQRFLFVFAFNSIDFNPPFQTEWNIIAI